MKLSLSVPKLWDLHKDLVFNNGKWREMEDCIQHSFRYWKRSLSHLQPQINLRLKLVSSLSCSTKHQQDYFTFIHCKIQYCLQIYIWAVLKELFVLIYALFILRCTQCAEVIMFFFFSSKLLSRNSVSNVW